MVLKDEDIRSLKNSPSSFNEEEFLEFEEEIIPCEGDLLLVSRLLRNHLVELEESKHENLFLRRCKFF